MRREPSSHIRDVDEAERPRERLMELGPGALSDADLLTLLFGAGNGSEGILETAERVARSVNLRRLQHVAVEELLAVRGMGPARAAQLLAASELGRRLWPETEPKPLVRGPEDVHELTRDIRASNREHFVGFYLNSRNQVLRREIISIGSLNASIVHPREVFVPAVALSAASLVLAHNHPSGDPTPSEEDIAITRRLVEAGRLLGIDLLDHVVVAREGYTSFKERRLLRASRTGPIHWLLLLVLVGCWGGCAGSKSGSVRGPAIDPSASPEELLQLADSALAAGQPDLARRALHRAAEVAPANPAVHVAYGRYYTATYRYKDAKAELERAMTLDPSSPEPHYWLGVAYAKAGDREEALRSFARALRLDPKHEGARRGLRPILEERYKAAGVPPEYAALPEHAAISRGELGVALAVELGLDPDRATWRVDEAHRTDWPALDAAWGSRWLRAAVARGWIGPFADRELHLEDPLTRGSLAILLAEIEAASARRASPDTLIRFADIPRGHYLERPASRAAALGLPAPGGRFEPQALASGWEALRAVRGLAHRVGAMPVVSGEP